MGSQSVLRAVFLDVGGTLLHEQPSRVEIYRRAALAQGLEVGPERMQSLMRAVHDRLPREIGPHFRYSEGWFAALIEGVFVGELGLDRRRLDPLRGELFARFADPGTFQLYPGALELLRSLRAQGLIVAAISNWSERLPAILAERLAGDELDFTLVSSLERVEKPEAAIFERALARAGVPPEAALHAGDDLERDVQGASGVGILPVLVDRSGSRVHARCARVADLHELSRWILGRLERT